MHAQLLRISNNPIQSFSVRHDQLPTVNNRWHFHPEYELVAIVSGTGVLHIGDRNVSFQPGDVFLTGPNQPHYYRFDRSYFMKNGPSPVDVKVFHFDMSLWGSDFLNLPENAPLKCLLEGGKYGIRLPAGGNGKKVGRMMANVLKLQGAFRLLGLIRILITIASEETEQLAKPMMGGMAFPKDGRWSLIMDYIHVHFKREIPLQEIAGIASMSPGAFCRFFKSHVGVTFTHYINNMRIDEARRLLCESAQPIKQICFECGFNNFSSFHRSFKAAVGKSPLNYRNDVTRP